MRAEEEAKRKRLKEEEDRLAKVRRDLEQKRRKAEEAAIYASLKEANLAKEQEKRLEQQRREAERKGKELREKEIALKAARVSGEFLLGTSKSMHIVMHRFLYCY